MSEPQFVTAGRLALKAAETAYAESGNMADALRAAVSGAFTELHKAGHPADIENRNIVNALLLAGGGHTRIVEVDGRLTRLWVSAATAKDLPHANP